MTTRGTPGRRVGPATLGLDPRGGEERDDAVESWFGVARSLAMYYGVPLRGRRMARLYGQFVTPVLALLRRRRARGDRIRAFRCPGARVVAVEPQAAFVRLLHGLYGRDGDVVVLPRRARSGAGTSAPLRQRARADGHDAVARLDRQGAEGSVVPGREMVRGRRGRGAHARRADRRARRSRLPTVKIDVEGFEAEVLWASRGRCPRSRSNTCPPRGRSRCRVRRAAHLAGGLPLQLVPRREPRPRRNGVALGADGIRRFLASLTLGSGSGDVYARLGGWTPSSPAPAPTSSS